MKDYKQTKAEFDRHYTMHSTHKFGEWRPDDITRLNQDIRDCIDKQIPLPPTKMETGDGTGRFLPFCPKCEHSQLMCYFGDKTFIPGQTKYCETCGQCVTWTDEDFRHGPVITKELVRKAYCRNDIRLGIDPNLECGVVAMIGDYWFYFEHEADESFTVEEFKKIYPENMIIDCIYKTLSDFRTDETFQDEYAYYFACLDVADILVEIKDEDERCESK